MTELPPNGAVHATGLDLPHTPVPTAQSVRGEPHTGTAKLADFEGLEIGVWEMTPGVATDVEVDEIFVVLSGSATIEFAGGTVALHVGSGDVVRLAAGTETIWTVTETLRKVYLTG